MEAVADVRWLFFRNASRNTHGGVSTHQPTQLRAVWVEDMAGDMTGPAWASHGDGGVTLRGLNNKLLVQHNKPDDAHQSYCTQHFKEENVSKSY